MTRRRAKAKVPDDIAFATKIAIAREMIAAALDAGSLPLGAGGCALWRRLPPAPHAGGASPALCAGGALQPSSALLSHQSGLVETDPKTLAEELPAEAWTTLAAGEGAKGLRLYHWARIALPWTATEGFERWLLIRRSRKDRTSSPIIWSLRLPARLAELAGAAGPALDHRGVLRARQGRSRPRPLRGPLLARLAPPYEPGHGGARLPCQARRRPQAHRLGQTERNESNRNNRRLSAMAALVPSVPEIRYLLARILLSPPISTSFIIAWSLWRRPHQANAAIAHYKRRSNAQL
jgi:hypothetical protein